MRRLKKSKNSISRDLENCFGFNENDVDLSIWNNSSVINSTMAPVDFQTDKPYRLALYVRPSHRRKVNVTNAFTLLKNASQKSSGKKNGSTVNSRIKSRSSLQNKRKAKDVNSVMLFDENVKPENETKVNCTFYFINNSISFVIVYYALHLVFVFLSNNSHLFSETRENT